MVKGPGNCVSVNCVGSPFALRCFFGPGRESTCFKVLMSIDTPLSKIVRIFFSVVFIILYVVIRPNRTSRETFSTRNLRTRADRWFSLLSCWT